ncbi:MAG: hypothetical protein PHW65_03200 [Dehalococcoidales bacterium]|nr:hypothetical protein [Dehalococcoidales bacterium]
MTPAQIQNIITAMNMSPGDREIFGTAPCNLKSNADIKRKTELEEFKCRQFAEEDGKSWQHWHLIRECYRTYHKSFSRIRCTNCGKLIPGGRLFGFEQECEPCHDASEPERVKQIIAEMKHPRRVIDPEHNWRDFIASRM